MPLLDTVLVLAAIGIWLYGLFDVLTTPDDECRRLSKPTWIALVALVPVVGAAYWLGAGRSRGPVPVGSERPHRPTRTHGPQRAEPARPPLGPDDDPEFLDELDRRLRGDD